MTLWPLSPSASTEVVTTSRDLGSTQQLHERARDSRRRSAGRAAPRPSRTPGRCIWPSLAVLVRGLGNQQCHLLDRTPCRSQFATWSLPPSLRVGRTTVPETSRRRQRPRSCVGCGLFSVQVCVALSPRPPARSHLEDKAAAAMPFESSGTRRGIGHAGRLAVRSWQRRRAKCRTSRPACPL